jgi:hypothetical protein
LSDEIETPLSSVLAALQQLHVPDDEFRRLDDAAATQAVARARDKFVVGRPRIWWLDLKLPKRVFDYEFVFEHLLEHIPAHDTRVWFIPDGERPERAVFDVDKKWLIPVLTECIYFEYYVLGQANDWLILDTDHDELIWVSDDGAA